MQVAKWGNSLAIRIPASFICKHGLQEGDTIDLIEDEAGTIRLVTRQHWLDELERLSALACKGTPGDWKDVNDERDDELAERRARLLARANTR